MKKYFYTAALLVTTAVATASDNSGYAEVVEIKSWPTKNDIYIEVAHNCEGSDKHRFHLSKDDNQRYSLLLSAFASGMLVNLNYTCASNGYPDIYGVRVRKQQ